MYKGAIYFVVFTILMFALHQFFLIPILEIDSDTVPVIFQHLLLGGFSLVIYLVGVFMAKHYFTKAGFSILGFLLLKMIFVGIFVYKFDKEMTSNPILKYVFVSLYFLYLIFLLIKIVPIINVNTPPKTGQNP